MGTYDQDFTYAMKLKLDRNRTARSSGMQTLANERTDSAPSVAHNFRDELMDSILEDRPQLTREELDLQMDAMGF